MVRKRFIFNLLSFSLNVYFLLYVGNSYLRRKKPTFNNLRFDKEHSIGGNDAVYEAMGKWNSTKCSNRESQFRITQRGRYFILNNYVEASRKFRCNESITYATHADYTFLGNLIPLTDRWNGPVSVAVHAPGVDFLRALASIKYLRSCGPPKLSRLVTFHLYFRDGSFPSEIPSRQEVEAADIDCDSPPPYAAFSSRSFPYPVNVGRNVARENALTHYVLVSDIELFPSLGLVDKFLNFVNTTVTGGKFVRPRVYPLPVFELSSGTEIPRNKTELVKLIRSGRAQTFHKTICSWCHRIPNFTKWLETKDDGNLNVFQVTKRLNNFAEWEPIYIGTNEEPFYDERLIWEGKRDKMTQGYVMCVLDYEFHVLDNAFLTHKPGIKKFGNSLSREYAIRKTFAKMESVIYPQLKILFGHRQGCKF